MLKAKHLGTGLIGKYSEKIGYLLCSAPQNLLKEEVGCDAENLNAWFNIPVFKRDSPASYD